jgi:hypothetical protein
LADEKRLATDVAFARQSLLALSLGVHGARKPRCLEGGGEGGRPLSPRCGVKRTCSHQTSLKLSLTNEGSWPTTANCKIQWIGGQRRRDMKIAVVGATGLGRGVVKHALEQGHFVTATARHPERLSSADRLSLVRGDVLSPGA